MGVIEDQPQLSVAALDMLDPRLPTRIARPPPPKVLSPLQNMMANQAKKRAREEGEWGDMKFHCPLTKICTMTADRMRLHMQGDLYKRLAASTSSWEHSEDKKILIALLNEAEQLEQQQQRAKKALNAAKEGVSRG